MLMTSLRLILFIISLLYETRRFFVAVSLLCKSPLGSSGKEDCVTNPKSYVVVRLVNNRPHETSKCGKNIRDPLVCFVCHFLFLTIF